MNPKTPKVDSVEEQSINPIRIQTLLYIVNKHKWKIMALFLSTVITVAIGSLLTTPIYQASAHLLVKPGREDIYVSPTGDSRAIVDYSYQGRKLQAEIAIMNNLGLTKELVNSIGVDSLFDYPDRTIKGRLFKDKNKKQKPTEMPSSEEVQKAVLANLDVSAAPESNVIDVTFSWPDPFIAARVVNELVDLYLVQHLKVHSTPLTYDLLKQQAQRWEDKLRLSEGELEAFKQLHNITSLSQQRSMLLERISEAESQKQQIAGDIQETIEIIGALEAQLSNLDRDVQLQETINTESSALVALRARLVDLELQGLKEEISRVKKMIEQEEKREHGVVVSGTSPILRDLESELFKAKARRVALKAKYKNQKAQIVANQKQLDILDSSEKQLKELERKVTIDEANYNLYLTKFEEAKISENMDKHKIANVSIIESALPVLKPVKPKKKLNVMIGGFLGFVAGICMAFLIEFINPVFHTREDVEQYLGLPVIGTFPRETSGQT